MRRETLVALGLAALPLPGGGAQASGGGAAAGEGYVNPAKGFASCFLSLGDGARIEAMTTRTLSPQARMSPITAGLEFARLNASALRAVDAQRLDHDLTAALRAAEPGLVRVLIVEVDARTG